MPRFRRSRWRTRGRIKEFSRRAGIDPRGHSETSNRRISRLMDEQQVEIDSYLLCEHNTRTSPRNAQASDQNSSARFPLRMCCVFVCMQECMYAGFQEKNIIISSGRWNLFRGEQSIESIDESSERRSAKSKRDASTWRYHKATHTQKI